MGDGLTVSAQQWDGGFPDDFQPYPGVVASVLPCDAPPTITNPVAVAAGGDDFTVVADGSGNVWTFGENDGGQLGNGSPPSYGSPPPAVPTPTQVIGVNNVVAVAAGYQHALALCAGGQVFAWGNNSAGAPEYCDTPFGGQLGIGNQPAGCPFAASNAIACQFPTNVIIVAVAAGSYHSVALDSQGNVWTFGENGSGQLGNGSLGGCFSNEIVTVPTMLTTISNVIAIAAGDSHTVVLRADKTVWTWGANGALGRPSQNGNWTCPFDPLPGQVTANGLSNVVAIAAGAPPSAFGGDGFTLAVTSNGQLYAWGDNSVGELGTFNTTQAGAAGIDSTNLPMLVAGLTNVVWVSAPRPNDPCPNVPSSAATHSLVMTLDQGTNHYWGFGDNTLGEIGLTTTNATSDYNWSCNYSYSYVSTPTGPVQFCTRCQREVPMGTGGVFTAQCSGMLYLYFNDDYSAFGDNAGSFTVSLTGSGMTNSPVAVLATNYQGIAVGVVTAGNTYTFSASGVCTWNTVNCPFGDCNADANGTDGTNGAWNCSDPLVNVNKTNTVCPTAQCLSLVGRIQ
jgi:alpha-tubulin suppressor-like RCC1 family protein